MAEIGYMNSEMMPKLVGYALQMRLYSVIGFLRDVNAVGKHVLEGHLNTIRRNRIRIRHGNDWNMLTFNKSCDEICEWGRCLPANENGINDLDAIVSPNT